MGAKRGNPNWKKGASGNPGGRPKGHAEFQALCREKTKDCVDALEGMLTDPNHCVAAAKALLEFGWGKPSQAVEIEHSFSEMTDAQLEARYLALLASGAK